MVALRDHRFFLYFSPPRISETASDESEHKRHLSNQHRDRFVTLSPLQFSRNSTVAFNSHKLRVCDICGAFLSVYDINDGMEDRYSVMIRFDNQISADNFYKHFRGKQFSSLEVEACLVLFTSNVQYTGSIEHAQTSPVNSMEQPSCAVCLEWTSTIAIRRSNFVSMPPSSL